MGKRRRRKRRVPEGLFRASIEAMSHDGRGIARIDGKTVFIDRALEGEELLFRYVYRRSSFDEGVAEEILVPSPNRVEPRCPVFGRCGGCSLQHMEHGAQVELKERNLLEQLLHFGDTEPREMLAPLTGPCWGYRRSARLGARYVRKRGEVLVGFRERWSGFVVEMEECPILLPRFSGLLPGLKRLIGSLSVFDAVPQVELVAGDWEAALVFRHLAPLSPEDISSLVAFGEENGVRVYVQPGGPDTVEPLYPAGCSMPLAYRHPGFGLDIYFFPGDFIQVNGEINRRLVELAVELLDPGPGEVVADFFCGVGNFSLPLAVRCGEVLAVEGSQAMAARGAANAKANGISNVTFIAADLHDDQGLDQWKDAGFNKVLLDPPRSGAEALCRLLCGSMADTVVYISCNPATLARDAGILATGGFLLAKAGVVDMFPQTAHAEAIALFKRL